MHHHSVYIGPFNSAAAGLQHPLHLVLPSHGPLDGERDLLDGEALLYNMYAYYYRGWMTVGCLEPRIFAVFIDKLVQTQSEASTRTEFHLSKRFDHEHRILQWD